MRVSLFKRVKDANSLSSKKFRFYRKIEKGSRSNAACCKVVWLDNLWARNRRVLEEEGKIDLQIDYIVSRPFHGSRLVEAIRLLPEFGGPVVAARNQSLKMKDTKTGSSTAPAMEFKRSAPGAMKPLSGKFVLVVEDNAVLQKAAKAVVSNLGANVEVFGNGADAVSVVSSRLASLRMPADGASSSSMLSYDFILMDCQMPVMDGYEATRKIRELEEEKRYNVRIPIIALTAHSQGPEVKMTYEAGMDSCLQKPLKGDRLLEVLRKLNIT